MTDPTSTNTAKATDTYDATLTPATPPAGATSTKGVAAAVTTPAHIVPALKVRVARLRAILDGVEHVGEVAWDDVEQVAADLRWLITFGRSKT